MKTIEQIEAIGLDYADVRQIRYFLVEKGDITRWTGWLAKKHLVEKAFPELCASLLKIEAEQLVLGMIITDIEILEEKMDHE